MQQTNFEEIHLSHDFPVSAAQLYEAWTDADQLKAWWHPMDDSLQSVTAELKPGGQVMYEFQKKTFAVNGIYQEVVPGKKLLFSWNWKFESDAIPDEAFTLDLTFSDIEKGCTLEVIQKGFADEDAFAAHRKGWEMGLQQLMQYLSGRE